MPSVIPWLSFSGRSIEVYDFRKCLGYGIKTSNDTVQAGADYTITYFVARQAWDRSNSRAMVPSEPMGLKIYMSFDRGLFVLHVESFLLFRRSKIPPGASYGIKISKKYTVWCRLLCALLTANHGTDTAQQRSVYPGRWL